jgi:DNA invertase Pin-like site-specific DNA recombinase
MHCVIYAAKSTEDRRGSIPDQLRECREALAQEGSRVFVAEYVDEAFSAFRRSRGPGLVDAMQHAEDLAAEHGSAELWAQHSDRLARGDGRSARHAVEIALWALKRGISVRTVQDPGTFQDLLYAVVTGQRNHEDSRRKGVAMAAGRRRAAARGDFIGYLPDGYKLEIELDDRDHVKKRMVIDPERREVIETIFRLALRGRRTGRIARALNDAGWRTKPNRKGVEPKKWTTERVGVVLRNPRYAGLAIFGGEIVARGHWPEYLSERQHARLRERMAAHRRGNKRPLRNETYLLAGLMRCGRCGEPLYCTTSNRRHDGSYNRGYVCSSHLKDKAVDRCALPPVAAEMLEAMFVASLNALLDVDHDEQLDAGADREPATVIDLAWERRQLRDAALIGEPAFQLAFERLLARAGPRPATDVTSAARRMRQLDAVTRFEAWTAEELTGRTDASRAEASKLNGLLASWFSAILLRVDSTKVELEVTDRLPAGQATGPRTTMVRLDRADWTRVACHIGRRRLRHSSWEDAEILGALQAWTEKNARSPTWIDWVHAGPARPNALTVQRHFGRWDRALRRAGLARYVPVVPPRNWAWSDAEVIQALRDWAGEHGRTPRWHEWLRATPGRPCNNTVYEHFGSWTAGLTAAGLSSNDANSSAVKVSVPHQASPDRRLHRSHVRASVAP